MLKVEDEGRVRVVTLNRPDKSNALHPELLTLLGAALDATAAGDDVHVVVLTGAGKRFCAGLDLEHLTSLDPDGRVEYMRTLFGVFRRITELPQPVIAAVNGPAVAGGFDLAAFCDLRLCSESAKFAQAEIMLGLTQVAYPLYEVIGLSRAMELALTGKAIDAAEAYRIGLVSGVHPEDHVLERTMDLARHIAERPPQALFASKRLTREVLELGTDAAFERMFDAISERLRSEEHLDALADHLERLARRRAERS